jgi:hypothetical protein
MTTVHFQGRIDEDGTIRLPPELAIGPGPVDVVLTTSTEIGPRASAVQSPTQPTGEKSLFQQLAEIASEEDWSDAPADLAENHDYYAHGAPKGIDSQ